MLGFAAPFFLLALAALPLLWLLLRFTRPHPQTEIFPPFILLKKLVKKEKTSAKSLWWLLLLRLLIAAFVIIALAKPAVRVQEKFLAAEPALIMMVDNSFSAAPKWETRLHVARQLLADLADEARVYLIPTIGEESYPTGPYQPREALDKIEQIIPLPLESDRIAAFLRIKAIAEQEGALQWIYLTDGLQTANDEAAFALSGTINWVNVLWYQDDITYLFGITGLENGAHSFDITAIRSQTDAPAHKIAVAYDGQGRRLGETGLEFDTGENQVRGALDLPFEMRNDIAFMQLEGERHAAASFVNASSNRRRHVAFLAQDTRDMVQPLTSPLYYPAQALRPFADVSFMWGGSMVDNIDRLLADAPALLLMGDEIGIADEVVTKLENWIEQGGTLLRFAGSNLASFSQPDSLLPVTLRRSERRLGGIMVWQTPQTIAPPLPDSPFFGLEPPQDVTISRQILPEPTQELYGKTWLNLADGTPLVTAKQQGKGRIIFVHTAAMPDWSNLPLSGFFVDMLRRIVDMTYQPSHRQGSGEAASLSLPAWQVISKDGTLKLPSSSVKPLVFVPNQLAKPTLSNPPGLYGREDFFVAVNLLTQDSSFTPLQPPSAPTLQTRFYDEGSNINLQGIFWGLALTLFALDSFIMLLKAGVSGFRWRRPASAALTVGALLAGGLAFFLSHEAAQAQWSDLGHDLGGNFSGKTHLAYVKTGEVELDRLSQSGLDSLSRFIEDRTSIELGQAVGVRLGEDELSFYPLLYWPIDAAQAMPTVQAMGRLDAYMRQGGAVLFDTRDYFLSDMALDDAPTPAVQRLRDILKGLNIPPLEPAPPEHVIARSFYIMPDFPGRYRGAPLWLEMTGDNSSRHVQAGDGISSILITANDFIGAWAADENRQWLFSTVPDEPMQRLWALRGGLNIVLYLLTGNYKADQIHAAEILNRLGR